MKPIEHWFVLHRAVSKLFTDYEPGKVRYIGNGVGDNAALGFVKPIAGDTVFRFLGIAVSAFCEATVQAPPFIACGRAGNGLVVLEPRQEMSAAQLAHIAAYINKAVRWRFNWYRQTTVARLRRIQIPDPPKHPDPFDVREMLPALPAPTRVTWPARFAEFALGDLYALTSGDFHNTSDLPVGEVPLVSCGDADNGITAFVDVSKEHTYTHRLTIALNGMNTLTPKFHPYRFAAKDDVAVCSPIGLLEPTTHVFVQVMLNRERWRYSYYRKCFIEKLKRFSVSLPVRGGAPDEGAMKSIIEAAPYWTFLRPLFGTRVTS